jgi:hypothetical protein
MNLPNDLFSRRLAEAEVENVHRAAIPLLVDCIEKMQLIGLTEQEIANIFRQAAEVLGQQTEQN